MNLQMVLKLIFRDFSVYRARIIITSVIALVVGMFMIFINTHLDRMFGGSSSFIILTIIVPFLPELKNKSVWIQTASLPVSRKAMVTSRFLSSLLISAINLLIWVIVFNVLMKVLKSDPKYALSSTIISIVWMNLIFSLALFYFAYYRFSFMVALGFYLFSMIIPQLLQTLLNRTRGFVLEDFNQSFSLSIMAISLLIISFSVSYFHFPKKDL
ncbi:ABC-2 transporter permease [uncultured Winogradskyella sp.]|uniref:ABC-2 transporter permease n=1 Tax=uncultured Winogradskyella sp. TaxID=395353 RepID=UPI0030D97FA8|tara:strand:+ start:227 stop:865 length:639 start_codon:yes stop_codon:yes gene_type:complete